MSRRPPSVPPELDGYTYLSLLGSGGFADVFLYRQARPQREVAVKVLLAGFEDQGVRRLFETEANVMAAMSTHPSIVTIHQADVSGDGRPFLVMEYCPRPNYGVRFRAERISVAESLRVGVQVAGAVETAHRAGILHRDIKPANILVTEYNRPALTDFGISVAAGEAHDLEDSSGMSIPWSPPEFFGDVPRADVRSDVFALAASIYSLLAGRSPFESEHHRNTAAQLIGRIASEPLPPLRRPDVPESLNRVLSVAMAKAPAARYDSALALGRALQQVEIELSLPVTAMDVLDERGEESGARAEEDELDAHTRIRAIRTVDPDAPPGAGRPAADPFAAIAPAPRGAPPARAGGEGAHVPDTTASTVLRPAGVSPSAPAESVPAARPRAGIPAWLGLSLAAVLVVGLGLGAVLAVRGLYPPTPVAAPTSTGAPAPIDPGTPDPPTDVTIERIALPEGTVEQKARISWTPPQGMIAEDYFKVGWDGTQPRNAQFAQMHDVRGRQVIVLDVPPGEEKLCATVRVAQDSGGLSEPATQCIGP